MPDEPREQTIEARGLTFHFVEWGAPDAPPMLLLHGLSSMCRIWDPLARAVRDRYRVIALDQRGHGDTSWPAEPAYSTGEYVADLEALTERWGLERFVLVGLSMGGMNSMAFAARHPDRVTHLSAVDIPPRVDVTRRPNREADRYVAEQGHFAFPDLEAAYTARKTTHPHTPDESLRHHVEHLYRRGEDRRWRARHDPRVSYHWDPADLWDELPKIEAPVLLVRGGQSQVLTDRTADRMLSSLRRAELVTIEEAGHTVPEDAPQRFIEAVEAFLARYPAPSPA